MIAKVGLDDILLDPCSIGVGSQPIHVGQAAGQLCTTAADELGLDYSCTVASGVIDAHCGAVGCIGSLLMLILLSLSKSDANVRCNGDPIRTLAVIGGTSACHMALSKEPCFVPGIWGPYFSAVVPNVWLNEAGQSAAGNIILLGSR